MKQAASMRSSQMISRSMKITGTTHALVAAVSAAVALNAMIAMQYLGLLGQVALILIVFVSLALGSLAVSMDIYSRTSQTVANLRSIGATSRSISSALAAAMVFYGLAGALLGSVAGVLIGLIFGGAGTQALSPFAESAGLIAASALAAATGFYAGAKISWRS